jgi:hypothetical protein
VADVTRVPPVTLVSDALGATQTQQVTCAPFAARASSTPAQATGNAAAIPLMVALFVSICVPHTSTERAEARAVCVLRITFVFAQGISSWPVERVRCVSTVVTGHPALMYAHRACMVSVTLGLLELVNACALAAFGVHFAPTNAQEEVRIHAPVTVRATLRPAPVHVKLTLSVVSSPTRIAAHVYPPSNPTTAPSHAHRTPQPVRFVQVEAAVATGCAPTASPSRAIILAHTVAISAQHQAEIVSPSRTTAQKAYLAPSANFSAQERPTVKEQTAATIMDSAIRIQATVTATEVTLASIVAIHAL